MAQYVEAAGNIKPLVGILRQAGRDKEPEVVRPVTRRRQAWGVVLTDVVERTHHVHVKQRRLSLSYAQDTQTDNTFITIIIIILIISFIKFPWPRLQRRWWQVSLVY